MRRLGVSAALVVAARAASAGSAQAAHLSRRRTLLVVTAAVAAMAFAGAANAAQLIDRNASRVKLSINTKSEALLTYSKAGKVKHVLVWGAINAAPPV